MGMHRVLRPRTGALGHRQRDHRRDRSTVDRLPELLGTILAIALFVVIYAPGFLVVWSRSYLRFGQSSPVVGVVVATIAAVEWPAVIAVWVLWRIVSGGSRESTTARMSPVGSTIGPPTTNGSLQRRRCSRAVPASATNNDSRPARWSSAWQMIVSGARRSSDGVRQSRHFLTIRRSPLARSWVTRLLAHCSAADSDLLQSEQTNRHGHSPVTV